MVVQNGVTLAERIKTQARRLGFDLVGIAPARPMTTATRYRAWLQAGYHGKMAYLARPEAVFKRDDVARILSAVGSVVSVGANYHTVPLAADLRDDASRGIIASYAWGEDYHDVLTPRLRQLGAFVDAETGGSVSCRAYVDTGPLLEREIATHAGLGFVGKNSNLIHPRLGSWLFLGELLLTGNIPAEDSFGGGPRSIQQGMCGRCTRCLDACPTNALVAPYVLDARPCLSYLTIELKGPIPRELRALVGNRVFGCDICQEVCPWNRRFARSTAEPAFAPRVDAMAPHLLSLIALDEDGFQRRFRGSPVRRAKRRGLLRNVTVALGNWGDPSVVPALTRALNDAEPLIRGHAAWALGRIASEEALRALVQALVAETDAWVREELRLAL